MTAPSLTVACVWVKGNVPYSADYVTRLLSMVSRHIDRPFEFLCFTDRPGELPSAIKTVPARAPEGLAGWWAKLELFNPAHRAHFRERALYIDLDSLIVGDLGPVVASADGVQSSFALVPHAGSFRPLGYRTVKRFNSSVMVWTPGLGLTRELYGTFHPKFARESWHGELPLWGDQDWIGERTPGADTMPAEWFPRFGDLQRRAKLALAPPSSCLSYASDAGARVVLVKKPKPHIAAERWPWFAEAWR